MDATITPGRPETWKPVLGYEGCYDVSDKGQVRSLDRYVAHYRARNGTQLKRGKIIAPAPLRGGGHLRVNLIRDGKKDHRLVHRLVLEAFAGPPEPGQEGLHGPAGVLVNWWPENLSWGTHRKNCGVDRHRDGAMWQAKLNPELVLICRARRVDGETFAAIATDCGVSREAVRRAIIGETWAWVA